MKKNAQKQDQNKNNSSNKIRSQPAKEKDQEDLIDESLKESFPASDPPSTFNRKRASGPDTTEDDDLMEDLDSGHDDGEGRIDNPVEIEEPDVNPEIRDPNRGSKGKDKDGRQKPFQARR